MPAARLSLRSDCPHGYTVPMVRLSPQSDSPHGQTVPTVSPKAPLGQSVIFNRKKITFSQSAVNLNTHIGPVNLMMSSRNNLKPWLLYQILNPVTLSKC